MTASNGASTNSGTSPAMSRAARPGTSRISRGWTGRCGSPRWTTRGGLPWFPRFLERLLENEPTVTALLETNPFPDKPPPYVRAQFYDYTYAGDEEKAKGRWWDRRLLGLYFPAVRFERRMILLTCAHRARIL